MGSTAKTKSGRIFRAPTDQARKLERKRENKKNKRDRQQIRQAIAKHLNVDECTVKMLAVERQLLLLDEPQFHPDVLRKKQKGLMDTLNKRRHILQQMKDEDELKMLNEKLQRYYGDVKHLQHLAGQQRLAREADVNTIPLPDGMMGEGDSRTTQIMGPTASSSAPAKKKVDFKVPRPGAARGKAKPPGPPCGLPLELSESEGEEDEYIANVPADDDLAPVPIPDDFDMGFNNYPPVMPIRNAPAPPAMPPMQLFNPMGIPMPMHPRMNPTDGSTISSAPVIRRQTGSERKDIGPTAPSVVTAAPQLRNLRQETVKLVPTVLKRTTTGVVKPKSTVVRTTQPTDARKQAKSTDDAYNDFMKELDGLL